jgi:hypothetical protein
MKRMNLDDQATSKIIELYCRAHPRSPSAVRRPHVIRKGITWIALLGPNLEEGIVGFGATIDAALRAFDKQYLNALRPPMAA